jgi:Outer membrane protein beta-barrel domain
MRKSCGLFVLLLLYALPALAQENAPTPQGQPEAPPQKPSKPKPELLRYELSGGYAYRSWATSPKSKIWMNGWYASFDYNLNRYFGLEGEGSGVYHSTGDVTSPVYGSTHIYGLLGGLKVYPLGHRKVTAYGHVLYGTSNFTNSIPAYGGAPANSVSASHGTWEAGGGIDLNFKRHWGVRIFQYDFGGADYFHNKNGGFSRLTAGVVYRWGGK